MENNNTLPAALKWAKWYCYTTIVASIYGIAWAHVPFMVGHPWASCEHCPSSLACKLAFHLFEVPAVLFSLYVAWYGLKRLTPKTVMAFRALLLCSVAVNFAFFAFETQILMTNLDQVGVTWQAWAIASIGLILMCGSFFAIIVHQKLLAADSR